MLGEALFADFPTRGGPLRFQYESHYGLPDREFDNRWSFLDPDDLDWATRPTLRYHAASGELAIETNGANGGHLSAFSLRSDAMFEADAFNAFIDAPLRIAGDRLLLVAIDAIEPGVYGLGEVLPPGLTRDQFQSAVTEAAFLGHAGFRQASPDFETHGLPMELVYVAIIPEPECAALAIAATAFSTRQPRRRLPAV